MRELKFRAWDTDKKKVVDIFECYDFYGRELRTTNNKYPLMQYTGLKDKNGKEIYEGDIVKDHHNCKQAVSWNEDRLCFECVHKSSGGRVLDSTLLFNDPEVIGNIYENGDLLK